MAEFTVSRLVGPPPGYVGYEEVEKLAFSQATATATATGTSGALAG